MSSDVAYTFLAVAPGDTPGIYRHGYGDNEAVNFCAVVANLGGAESGGPITITQGDTYRHVDGTVARTAYVHNSTPSWFLVQIIETIDAF